MGRAALSHRASEGDAAARKAVSRMHALVVYESVYGNTKAIAEAIADGLRTAGAVDVMEVGAAPTTLAEDVDVLVVGGPTHAHGMTTADTRANAAKKADRGPVSERIGVREWLSGLPVGTPTVAAAAFDTTLKGPSLLWGSAARGVEQALRDHHFRILRRATSFHVNGPFGPVYDAVAEGELDRARDWGKELASRVS
jgi:hypothetical protein